MQDCKNTSQLDICCLRSNSILGCRVAREITGRFYGLHLHNMHKLISLERIKDYGTKIALSRKSKRIWISKDKKRKKDHKIEMTQFQGMVLYRKPGARGSKWHCHKFIRRNYEKFQLISNNHSTQLVKPAQLHKRWMYKVHWPKIALTAQKEVQVKWKENLYYESCK